MADFGRIVAGLVQLEVSAPAGTTFDLCYVEDPLTGKEQGFGVPHNGTRYIARGADDVFETFDVNGLRRIYLVIHGTSGPVTRQTPGRPRDDLPLDARRFLRML